MNTKKHRHFIAIPALSLALLLTAGASAAMPLRAETGLQSIRFAAEDTELPFQIDGIVAGVLQPGAAITASRDAKHLELVRGEALMYSVGLTNLSIGTATVHLVGGSLFVLRDSAQTTVAAVGTPVLVSSANELWVAVPGQQLAIQKTGKMGRSTVPPEWYASEASNARDIIKAMPKTTEVPALAAMLQGKITAEKLVSIRAAELADPGSHIGKLALLSLLQADGRMDDAQAESVALYLKEDASLVREAAFAMPVLAHTILQPIPAPLLALWPEAIVEASLAGEQTEALESVHSAAGLPHLLDAAGFPKQAILWRTAVTRAIELLRTVVPPDQVTKLAEDSGRVTRGTLPEVTEAAAIEVTIPLTTWSEEELISMTRQTLVAHGAMIATSSVFTADASTQLVHVTNIFVAEGSKDVAYEFNYDPARDELSSIVRDGKKLPNTVSAKIFFQ